MTIGELVAALEAATGPDRELDAEVYKAEHPKFTLDRPHMHERLQSIATLNKCPRYTASLDAALTLVPEGAAFQFLYEPNAINGHDAIVWPKCDKWVNPNTGMAVHKYLAIALCIAALKARAAK